MSPMGTAARMEQPLRIVRVDAAEIAALCKRHKLDDDMCQLFVAKALDPLDCFFEFNDDELRNPGTKFHYFTDPYITALRLAVKKALSEKDSTVRVITPKEEDTDGGDDDGAGGRGGGASSGVFEYGGSLDEAPLTPTLFVALFTKVPIGQSYLGLVGGRGGRGGTFPDGRRGKDGESQEIAVLTFPYHEEPRHRKFTMTRASEVPANLRGLIMDGEFQFVGGLLEVYDTDMQSPSFVEKFEARREILVRSTN
ncbi:hypothetical protein C8R45DRAFT_1014029 [Mycena sanguinolenta]|nr:hypothetical protein C8R45DRAFT_1014029 [Mycena sanguinolenta]